MAGKNKKQCLGAGTSQSLLLNPSDEPFRNHSVQFKDLSKPRKLYEMCRDYISLNLDLVDSLLDFPEQIGQDLLRKSIESGKLSNPDEAEPILKLYGEAYPQQILSTFVLDANFACSFFDISHLLFSYMRGLVIVDLAGCQLGDDKEILNEQLDHLEKLKGLGLRGVNLSDYGVQLLTARARIKETSGLGGLIKLDLSENNRITNKSLHYLCGFKNLRMLDVSGTSITDEGENILKIKQDMLRKHDAVRPIFQGNKTVGWLAGVVNYWLKNKAEEKEKSKSKKTNFYGCRKSKHSTTFHQIHQNDPIGNHSSQENSHGNIVPNKIQTKNVVQSFVFMKNISSKLSKSAGSNSSDQTVEQTVEQAVKPATEEQCSKRRTAASKHHIPRLDKNILEAYLDHTGCFNK